MQVQRQESGGKGSFYIKDDGQKSALMTYKKSGENEITIDHTEVDEVMQSKGLGKQMVSAAVEYARENDIKIVPVCPFVKKIIDETPEYQDVLS
ncbi:GNAT family N-acetyltransferase [soil metagenome]|jgi:predicted GNAT family acetyltransferase|nr:N-acetyltransferase [Acidobacteriota bacterium]